jgi:catechol 2,3-dioxygenase-like lactoylglutathione lyase family enzyme
MKNGKKNGAGITADSGHAVFAAPKPPPGAIAELAEACVRFVERSLGVKLDYQPETLPLLDHYIEDARAVVKEKPEMLSIVAQASGAYFGEVVRRRHASWWRTESDDPGEWQIQLEAVFLAFSPVRLVLAALLRDDETSAKDGEGEGGDAEDDEKDEDAPEGEDDMAHLTLEEDDRAAIFARLADLPAVSEREFFALSTRLEVIDIAVEAIRAKHMAEGEETEGLLSPEDYE